MSIYNKEPDLFGKSKIVFAEGKPKKTNTLFEYDGFVEKFKNKKTTDDCYTPKPVFDVVLNYLKDKGKLKDVQTIIRPFFPGNDYKEVEYPDGCVVVDNPPFSIFSKIVRFYINREIPFFLFAPHLTLFSPKEKESTAIVVGVDIVYENGAKVKTSFSSNLFGDIQAFSDYQLYKDIEAANTETTSLPKYAYPDEILTVSDITYMIHKGVEFEVKKDECIYVSRIDDQKKYGKSIFGAGLLISREKAMLKGLAKAKADENAKASEDDRTIKFRLSKREIGILDKMEEKV